MEEWEYIEGHKDLYKDMMMENRPPLTSPDGSSNRNTPQRSPHPNHSQDSMEEPQEITEDNQDEHQIDVKVEITDKEEKYSQTDLQCKEENVLTDRSSNRNTPERCPHPVYSRDSTEHHEISQINQEEHLIHVKVENAEKEDKYSQMNVLYKEENVLTDGSSKRNTPERCPRPLFSRGSTEEHQEILQDDQDEDVIVVKVEDVNDEEAYGRCKEEEVAAFIRTDGRYSGIKSPKIFQNSETEGEVTASPRGVLFSGPLTHGGPLYKTLPNLGLSQAGEPFSHQRTPAGEDSYPWSEGEEGLSQNSCQDQSLEAEVKSYSCSVCGKSFRVKSVLIRHVKVHTGEKPYECSQCGKSFAQKSDLAEHERIHTGEKPYPCPVCGKCFAKKTNLARHLRMHSGVKPYACSVCGKAFTQKAALDEHMRIHTGEKPYACSHCAKCFAQKSAFAEHQRVHTGERPYACSECGKRFTQGSALAKHQRVHQNQKPRPCPQCGKLFPSEFLLALHERVHQANF